MNNKKVFKKVKNLFLKLKTDPVSSYLQEKY